MSNNPISNGRKNRERKDRIKIERSKDVIHLETAAESLESNGFVVEWRKCPECGVHYLSVYTREGFDRRC